MTKTLHLLTGEYPPQHGGVGDYTSVLASALGRRGCEVHVWSPMIADGSEREGVTLHALSDVFDVQARRQLERALPRHPGRIILQYVPNALGRRGANLAFCRWFAHLRRRGLDARVMFHEPYFYFSAARPAHNMLAVVQRLMAAALLRASPIAYLSTETWVRYLRPYAPAGTSWVTLPIPATVPSNALQPDASRRWRAFACRAERLVGHFGTYGDRMTGELAPALVALLERDPGVHALLIGRGSDGCAASIAATGRSAAGRVHAAGELPPDDVAPALHACDVLMQPYPDGVTTRRTSVMAGLAAAAAVVTTDGPLTEQVWRATEAARLVPISAAGAMRDAVLGLLDNVAERKAQAAKGKRAYDDRFAIEHTVGALLSA